MSKMDAIDYLGISPRRIIELSRIIECIALLSCVAVMSCGLTPVLGCRSPLLRGFRA